MTLIGYNKAGGTLDPVSISGTVDVDIKTLGGSVVPAGPLDTDIITLGGSVVPAGPLPVTISGDGALDVTCSTVHADGVAVSFGLADDTSNTQYFWVDTDDNQIFYPTLQFGYDGTYWDRIRTVNAVSGGTITHGLLATDHVVRRLGTVFFDDEYFQGTQTSANSADWNVTDYNKLGLMITLTSSGTPTDMRIIAQFKDWTGTYYDYMNDFWGDMRWEDTACASGINEVVMGDLPVGTLRIRAVTQGTSTTSYFRLTVKGQVYTW